MPRKLKTFVTNLGFFELAIAAPSMKAALEAWGMRGNSFKQGFARETDDAKIVAATMARPGTVLKRPVGTKGVFAENAELPTLSDVLSKDTARPPPPAKRAAKTTKPKKITRKENGSDRADIISFEKAKKEREQKHAAEAARQEAQRKRDQARIGKAVAKAQAALDDATGQHETALAEIAKERDRLDRRAKIEEERWEKERERLKGALERAAQ
jgi:colicin import membrane protein